MNFMHIIYILLAYLIGSIPTGVWYSRLKHQQDVRELGSGNSGATNVGRNFGFRAAVLVTAVDVLKGWIPMGLAMHYLSDYPLTTMAIGIAAVLGHSFPIFAGFRGGKIVATSIGVMLGYHFWLAIFDVVVLFTAMYVTSMVSAAAIISYGVTAIVNLFIAPNPAYKIGFVLVYIWLLYRHRQNISRLLKGEESRLKFGLNQDKKK